MLDLTHIFATFPELRTGRTVLRATTPDDADALFEIMRDPQVNRYLSRPPMASREEAVQRIQIYQQNFAQQEGILWGIALAETGTLIGTGVYWNLNRPHSRAEIGYILGSAWWRQGIMTEVAEAMLDFGFSQMGLHSIEAQLDPDNTASRRLLEKLGFVQEAHFRENYYDPVREAFTDTAVYSLLKSGWLERRQAG